MTSSRESLFRYKLYNETDSAVVEKPTVFKRIPPRDSRILELSRLKQVIQKGDYKPFRGIRYDIYALYSGVSYIDSKVKYTGLRGYRLLPHISFNSQSSNFYDELYFVYEREEL